MMLFAMLSSNGGPPDSVLTVGVYFVLLVFFTAVDLLITGSLLYAFYLILTLPMRRNERARLFFDLVELGLQDGDSPEKTITALAARREVAPDPRFHTLARHLEKGMKLGEALTKTPGVLPPQIVAMLRTGERIGSIDKILPACRKLLNDGVSQVRGALNYLLALTFLIVPSTVIIPLMINVVVIPKFKEVFAGMSQGMPLPAFTQMVFGSSGIVLLIQIFVMCLVWFLMLAYIGGPRFHKCFQIILPGLSDRVHYSLPWRRKRLERDFSSMLAVLLDSEVPEAEAVSLAAESTNNRVIRRRALKVVKQLGTGVKLPVALRVMDDSGELQWRLSNALQRGSGFLRSLEGWHEALDAKAFQLEQAAAQIATSVLVLFNGAVVASVCIAMFLVLVHLVNEAALW